jgi:hypothetical protein
MRVSRIGLLVTLVAAGGLFATACGGGGDSSAPTPGASDAATEQSTAATATAPSTPVPTPEPRPDGLTGAPVEPPTAPSAEFDATRLNVNGGSFPPLDYPSLASVEEATWLDDGALVLGAVQNDEARAYPLSMMRFHHVANDELGGEPYLVTF